ncbi:MAG: 1-acyl-sn-glycerol-3-phosphate acyltransferase [Clostridia bacterium]|nr:1-acyl-sn-glycerol-3-phosphate acyltransferase [Clostridia bacterium]
MKIIPNIPAAVKLFREVKSFNKNLKKIEDAKAAGDFEEERKWILDSTSTFGPMIMKDFGCDLHVHGEENIPDRGPVVIVANHQSYADIPTLMAVFRKFQFGFIAKQYLAKAPFLGPWMPRIRSVFIENDNPRSSLKAINTGIEYINDGFSMAICPEGTRSKGPFVGPFMKGAMKLATKPGVPSVRAPINGTYRTFEETGVARGARIDVSVHPPIETAGISRAEEKLLSDRVEEIIRAGVEEIVSKEQA